MKKGFSLIELVVVVALIGILLSVASLSSRKTIEKRALKEAKNKIALALRGAAERSFNDGEIYTVTLDYNKKTIVIEDSSSNIEESLELPEMLEYTTIYDDAKVTTKTATTTINGGMTSFSVYIFDSEENATYRISVDGINVSKLSYVNIYENESADVNWTNIDTYKFSGNEDDWIKE